MLSNRVSGSKQMQIFIYLNHCFWQEQGITVTLELRGGRPAMTPFRAKLNDELTD
jgi:hypothetical protein